jgi:hypothetical protein
MRNKVLGIANGFVEINRGHAFAVLVRKDCSN